MPRRLAELPELQGFAKLIEQRHELLTSSPEAGERDHWQDAVELDRGEGDKLTLLVRGAPLPQANRLVVFDDITEVVSAQRSAAWAEVARRLAHEIRNPLTPIQLSAERLQHKLEARLEGGDQALLKRSVATIVSQVHAMQKLVNEFRDYARLPRAQLVPLDLNALVTEVLGLYGQALDRGVLSAELAEHPPRVMGDATQLRQVIHNLVQNAMDAIAERADGHVKVITWLIHDDHGALKYLRLSVQDNGPGFPEKVLKRAFEPYVTTKAKGTGLGLAVVRKIADDHGARLRALNLHEGDREDAPVIGARVSLSFSTFAPAAPGPEAPDAPAPATGDTRQAH
jgi:nitrogen fixation/metabolism regulation signal transduction histidine kinase